MGVRIKMSDLPTPPVTPAEEAKARGNEAFIAKNYDEAMIHYSEAITLNPDCAVYYSNRSAVHALKQNWQAALDDANICVAKDPKFVKGYLRLVTAQISMNYFDEAESNLKIVESLEPENQTVPKLRREIKKTRQDQLKAQKSQVKQFDESELKELQSIKEQVGVLSRDLQQVMARLEQNGRDVRIMGTTKSQVDRAPDEANMFRSVGMAYVKESKPDIIGRIDDSSERLQKSTKDLLDRKQYLERRITELMTHRNDIMKR